MAPSATSAKVARIELTQHYSGQSGGAILTDGKGSISIYSPNMRGKKPLYARIEGETGHIVIFEQHPSLGSPELTELLESICPNGHFSFEDAQRHFSNLRLATTQEAAIA